MQKVLLLATAALLLAHSAFAAQDNVVEKPLIAETLNGFTAEAERIHQQMQPGGAYALIKPADKMRVESRLGDMQKLLQSHASENDLPRADKLTLVNAQEEVNGILRHNDSNRRICESRAPVGSHIPVTTCRTFGEIEQRRQSDSKTVNDMDRSRIAPVSH
jgi:hypothetical protein